MRWGFAALAVGAFLLVAVVPRPHQPGRSSSPEPRWSASTSRDGLERSIASGRARVAASPADGEAAAALADALLRAARVRSDAALASEAERVLRATLRRSPDDYAARRMLGVVYLSQHRFAEAIEAAREAQAARPDDAWNHAVAGDALLELGQYDAAFDAFDAVMARRPDAAAYARVAYARELQGDLGGAVRLMQMAAESTAPHDAEARAWTAAQLGNLYLLQGKLAEAERELNRADFTFPSHPYSAAARIRLHIARGDHRAALRVAERAAETPESLATRGDLLARLGQPDAAEEAYRKSEQLERDGWKYEEPQPAALARFLAERGRSIPEAVALAETAVAGRRDIHTLDALAWACFRAGRVDDAAGAIRSATRTGTRDPRIRCHARAIAAALTRTPEPADRACNPLDLVTAAHEPIRLAHQRVEGSERN